MANKLLFSTGYLDARDAFILFFSELSNRQLLNGEINVIDKRIRKLKKPSPGKISRLIESIERDVSLALSLDISQIMKKSDWLAVHDLMKAMHENKETASDDFDLKEKFQNFVRVVFGKLDSKRAMCNMIVGLLKDRQRLPREARNVLIFVDNCLCQSLNELEEIKDINETISLKDSFPPQKRIRRETLVA